MRFDTDIQMRIRDAYAARHEPEAARLLAHMYWAICILVLSGFVVAAVGYGAWEFFRTPAKTESSASVRPQATFSRQKLQDTLGGFDTRAGRFETRLTAPIPLRDPSN